jgi:hypothetical protein
MPHDSRIHSEKKSKNLDGTWRYKRGVADEAIAVIENALKGTTVHAVAAPVPAIVAPPPAVTTPAPVTLPPLAQPVAPPQVAAPVVAHAVIVEQAFTPPPARMAAPTKPAHTLATFKNNLTELLAQFINEGKINQEYVKSLCDYFKIKDIWNVLASERQCMELFDVFVKADFVTRIEG